MYIHKCVDMDMDVDMAMDIDMDMDMDMGGRALHADDAHSEAKAGHDSHHEIDSKSGPGF